MKKWFRVATEGATTDGRKISRVWIEQMAASYDQAKYGARIWLEHFRGLFADGPFKAYGDITRAAARDVEDGLVALFVEIEPHEDLLRMNKDKQKVYTSIEVDPEFAGTGEAYLVGMGITDSPASLGTEMLRFSASSESGAPLSARKQNPHNIFTAAIPLELDFSGADHDGSGDTPSLLDQVKAFFVRHKASGDAAFSAFRKDLEDSLSAMAEEIAKARDAAAGAPDPSQFAGLKNAVAELASDKAALTATVEKLTERLSSIESDPDAPPRKPALGGSGQQLADF